MSTERFKDFLEFAPHSVDFDFITKVPVDVALDIVDAVDKAVLQGGLCCPDGSVEKFLIRSSQSGASRRKITPGTRSMM